MYVHRRIACRKRNVKICSDPRSVHVVYALVLPLSPIILVHVYQYYLI